MGSITSSRSTITKIVTGAAVALAVTGGSAAIAAQLPNNVIESRHIKDGTVRSVDLANGSVTGRDIDEDSLDAVPFSQAAQTADHALFAGQAETASRLLGFNRATVSATGTLRSTDFGAVSSERTSTPGRYLVTFDGPILGCSLIAGVAHNETAPVAGSASAWITPLQLSPAGSKVTVETHAASSADAVADPLPFNLMAVC